MPRRNKSEERDLAVRRIRELVSLAQRDVQGGHAAEAQRAVALARRIGMRYQVSLPSDVRRRVCRSCDAVLVSGRTARHRLASGRVIVTCLQCGTVKRYPYRGRRGSNR